MVEQTMRIGSDGLMGLSADVESWSRRAVRSDRLQGEHPLDVPAHGHTGDDRLIPSGGFIGAGRLVAYVCDDCVA